MSNNPADVAGTNSLVSADAETEKKGKVLEKATDEYLTCTKISWKSVLKKHGLDDETLSMLIERYATEETCKPVEEWKDAVSTHMERIGNKFKVDIYHNDVDVEVEYR